MSNRMNSRLKLNLRDIPRRDFYFAVGFATLATVIHFYGLFTDVFKPVELEILISPTIPRLLLMMGLFLLLSTVCLWIQRPLGLIISILGLAGTGAGYLLWYIYSRPILKTVKTDTFYQLHPEAVPLHPLGFIDAKWWNLVVFAMLVSLFVWEVKTLVTSLSPNPVNQPHERKDIL